jgi:hypothetical protein
MEKVVDGKSCGRKKLWTEQVVDGKSCGPGNVRRRWKEKLWTEKLWTDTALIDFRSNVPNVIGARPERKPGAQAQREMADRLDK